MIVTVHDGIFSADPGQLALGARSGPSGRKMPHIRPFYLHNHTI